jgi:prolyl-tRNA synthetase
LNVARGIELGHVFQLGRKYAEAFGLTVSDADGRPVTLTMGSYGIGISRAVAALAEQTHDSLGLRWPRRVAPADLHLVATGRGDEAFEVADELALRLAQRGVRVLYDDRRGSSAGVKFADAELLGLPRIVIVGRGLADGMIEVRDRSTGETRQVALVDAPDLLANHND